MTQGADAVGTRPRFGRSELLARTRELFTTKAPPATILIRLSVGTIFISEGMQKFLFEEVFGVGRYAKIGLPMPGLMAPFVGALQIACGVLVLVGLLTRVASLFLAADMFAAILTTKLPIVGRSGFWAMAHEAPMDVAMLFGCAFLVIVGAGPLSVDARVVKVGGASTRTPRLREGMR
jgi:putative oxidoreductase